MMERDDYTSMHNAQHLKAIKTAHIINRENKPRLSHYLEKVGTVALQARPKRPHM